MTRLKTKENNFYSDGHLKKNTALFHLKFDSSITLPKSYTGSLWKV